MTEHRSYLRVPRDWTRVEMHHVGAFVTSETFRRADGSLFHWTSRAHRKTSGAGMGSTWWAPRTAGWWIGVLFMVGSACFAIGPLPAYLSWVGVVTVTATFFIGSIFFTLASVLQYIQMSRAPRAVPEVEPAEERRLLLGIEPARVDWWACAVQLVGTIFFNITTGAAFLTNLTATQQRRIIWTPDALGSICFLVASWLAYIEVGHQPFSWLPKDRGWWIAALNMIGSIAFGVSAIVSFVRPATGDAISLFWTNFGTFVGAVCFFAGALLLLPERTHPDPHR